MSQIQFTLSSSSIIRPPISINYTSGIPGTIIVSSAPSSPPPPPFPTTSLLSAFSLKLVISTYTGPIINITTTNTSTSGTDFYAPSSGDLNTAADGSGTSLTTFLSGNSGYITKWYDQSTYGCHMSCSSSTLQPQITKYSGKYQIDFSKNTASYFNTSANSSVGPIPWDNTKGYTVICHYNTISSGTGGICGCGNNVPNTTNNFRRADGGYQNYWFYNDITGGTYNQNNTVTFTYNIATQFRYIYDNNNTSPTTSQGSSGWSLTTSTNQMVGKTTADSTAGASGTDGQIFCLYTFNATLSDIDRLTIINNYT
jgi:hypothetical protein